MSNSSTTIIDLENNSSDSNSSNSNNSDQSSDQAFFAEIKIIIPKCICFKRILIFLHKLIANIYIQFIKCWYSRSIINKIRIVMIFYDTLDYFYRSFYFNWILNIASESLNNNIGFSRLGSRLKDMGITEKHIGRCVMLLGEIGVELSWIFFFFQFLKYMIFPYILDGFIMPHIIGIIEKLHSRQSSD